MKLFQDDGDIQLEGFMLLASIGELLYNNGYATEVFKLIEVGIRKHAGTAPWCFGKSWTLKDTVVCKSCWSFLAFFLSCVFGWGRKV